MRLADKWSFSASYSQVKQVFYFNYGVKVSQVLRKICKVFKYLMIQRLSVIFFIIFALCCCGFVDLDETIFVFV